MTAGTAIDLRLQALPHQREVYRADAEFIGVFGGWGSGKSTAAADRLLRVIGKNPHDLAKYGRHDRPLTIVAGPTSKVLRESMWRTMNARYDALIAKRWETPPMRILWRNGHLTSFRSFEALVEGANACGILVDEAHLIHDVPHLMNFKARARDPLANERCAIVCGLPEDGPLREVFDQPIMPASMAAFYFRTDDNHFLPKGFSDQFRAAVSYGEAMKYLEGKWMVGGDAVFHSWDSSRNVVDLEGDTNAVTHLAFDVGDRGFALWGQEVRINCKRRDGSTYVDRGLLIVDDLACDNLSTEGILQEALRRPWKLIPGKSNVYTDPTIRRDELQTIERYLPGMSIVRRSKGEREFDIPYGVRCINRALRDVDDNSRLMFSRSLLAPKARARFENPERGIVRCVQNSKKDPWTGYPKKENRYEHGRDCLRYMVSDVLPAMEPSAHVVYDRDPRRGSRA
jgi:hypothetical protein